jgi:hypothetical protein
VAQAETEATRPAALNRTSESQPLRAIQKIEYTDAFSLFVKPRLATPVESLIELGEGGLLYEMGSNTGAVCFLHQGATSALSRPGLQATPGKQKRDALTSVPLF